MVGATADFSGAFWTVKNENVVVVGDACYKKGSTI